MKFVDEYRQPEAVAKLAAAIRQTVTRPWTIMEVCGGQTHAIIKYGIDQMLPPGLRLLHGPGCPVCVTPHEIIDAAVEIAGQRGTIICSFGDMLRVPGSGSDLAHARAAGGDVRSVYSPLDAVTLAARHPNHEVVFLAVGFETTAPVTALAIREAHRQQLRNFSMLVAHVRVPPALRAILSDAGNHVQAFLAAGHVCTIMGWQEYPAIAAEFRVPIVVTGFEPVDLLEGIWMAVRQLESGRCDVENQYARAVRPAGNVAAIELLESVYEVVDCHWRGLGIIRNGGLRLRPEWKQFDALQRFQLRQSTESHGSECRAGDVLRGIIRPDECPAFGTQCTPEMPLGAPMVSNEGACAAYYRYGRSTKSLPTVASS
jgi:hydrogenase expression/formation protein HypD